MGLKSGTETESFETTAASKPAPGSSHAPISSDPQADTRAVRIHRGVVRQVFNYAIGAPLTTKPKPRERLNSIAAKEAPLHVNDPSAGSPTETLLRLLLPLNEKVQTDSQQQQNGNRSAASILSFHRFIQ